VCKWDTDLKLTVAGSRGGIGGNSPLPECFGRVVKAKIVLWGDNFNIERQ